MMEIMGLLIVGLPMAPCGAWGPAWTPHARVHEMTGAFVAGCVGVRAALQVMCMHQVVTAIISNFEATMSSNMLKACCLEALRFTVPYVEKDGRVTPWLFEKPGNTMTVQLKLLCAKMQGSVTYTKKRKPAKAKRTPKKKAQKGQPAVDMEPDELMDTLMPDGRTKYWLDDVVGAITSVLEACSISDAEATTLARSILSFAFEFAWTGSVCLNGKEEKAWSAVRPILKYTLKCAVEKGKPGPCSSSGVPTQQALMDVIRALSDPEPVAVASTSQPTKLDDILPTVDLEKLQMFAKSIARPVPVQKPFLTLTGSLVAEVEGFPGSDSGTFDLREILRVVGAGVFSAIDPSWTSLCKLAAKANSNESWNDSCIA